MNTYEFITPSDPITFLADDDKVAFVCSIILGNGKAGCRNLDADVSIPSMLIFSKDPDKDILEFMGGDMKEFIETNKQKIKDCFYSFAYGDRESRIVFNDAISAITDEDKRKDFRAKHEDRNRSSMSQWVKTAWKYAGEFK